jgi:hypothetical protein
MLFRNVNPNPSPSLSPSVPGLRLKEAAASVISVQGMRHSLPEPDREQGEVIAEFGQARLIKKLDCKYELVGGSEADRAEAQKWISLFMKDKAIQGLSDQR